MNSESGAARARHRLGKYELLEEVGRGGMGVVYRAFDHSLKRVVAVKLLRDKLLNHPLLVSRFQREAKAAASLNHPNIVQIYSVGWLDDVLHIAMEFIEGASLAKLMQDQGRVAWKHALDFGYQVASALECAHAAQVIHRDVKLTNILIDPCGRAYVTDFGIAKILTADTQLTVQGERLGTPQYMAPERFGGGELTPSSDLYSLGVVLFQLISGRLPYEAQTQVELIKKISSDPPTRLREFVPSVPEDVERLVAYLIEKKPKDRPESAADVCDAIDRVRSGRPLDNVPSYAPTALAEFREALEQAHQEEPSTPASRPKTPMVRPKTPTSGRFFAATTRWSQKWTTLSAWTRASLLVGMVTLLAVYPAYMGVSRLHGNPAVQAVAQTNAEVERWSQAPRVAEFSVPTSSQTTARVNLASFAAAGGAWWNGELVLELEGVDGTPRAGQRAVCALEPDTQGARLCMAPAPVRWMNAGGTAMSAMRFVEGTAGAHPNGVETAIAESSADGGWFIATWDSSQGRMLGPKERITEAGPRISYVAYAPTGERVAYVRNLDDGKQQLWVASLQKSGPLEEDALQGSNVAPHEKTWQQTLLAEGTFTAGASAFAPDGRALVVGRGTDGEEQELVLIDAANGSVLAEYGTGWMAQWLPRGDGIVVSAADEKGQGQLWSIDPANPNRRVRLTDIEGGCARHFHVSRGGEWVAAVKCGGQMPEVTFVRVSEMGN